MSRILSIQEFEAAFPDEEACWAYLVRVRWPGGFACPRCDGREACFIRTRRLFECKACGYQCSVTAGTSLHRSKQSLRTWFWAVYLIGTTKQGISACELQRKLGLRTYRTAWFLRRKVQHALRTPEGWLRGLVEVDEVYVGPVTRGRGGRGTGKAPVAVAVEERGSRAGRMAAEVVLGVGQEELLPFLARNVEPGTSYRPGPILKTDGWKGYRNVEAWGYQHAPEVEGDPKRAPVVLPRVHIVAGNLKRVLDGTHSGRVSVKHMAEYVAEFRFRYNHRGWLEKTLPLAFQRLVQVPPLTFQQAIN